MKKLVIQLLPHRQSIARDIAISGLAILSAAMLILELSSEFSDAQIRLIYTLDIFIALAFLADFLYEFSTATNRKKYFKQNWYLLLASVPITGGTYQALRSVQLIRLMRIVRLYARIRKLSEATEHISRNSSRYIFIALFSTIVIFVGSSAFYLFETTLNYRIDTYFDALWWAVVTATSVGYGDIYPVTHAGRVTAMFLMVFGVALLGSVVGLASNYFLYEEIQRKDK
jgi:voltage-gated potassium channel